MKRLVITAAMLVRVSCRSAAVKWHGQVNAAGRPYAAPRIKSTVVRCP